MKKRSLMMIAFITIKSSLVPLIEGLCVKEHERARYDFDPTMFYENRFWNQRPDGIVINKHHRTLYILEFKRSSDRNKDFLRVKEDEANEQHRSIIDAGFFDVILQFIHNLRPPCICSGFCGREAWCSSGR